MYFNPSFQDESNGSILIMWGDQGTCRQIRECLQNMNVLPDTTSATEDADEDARGPSDAAMMRRKLRNYFLLETRLQTSQQFSLCREPEGYPRHYRPASSSGGMWRQGG